MLRRPRGSLRTATALLASITTASAGRPPAFAPSLATPAASPPKACSLPPPHPFLRIARGSRGGGRAGQGLLPIIGISALAAAAQGGGADCGSGIEVEQKFAIESGLVERLGEALRFQGEKRMEDTYYDVPDLRLTGSDHWLRVRDGAWELKQPIARKSAAGSTLDTYREITDEGEIGTALEALLGLEGGALAGGPLADKLALVNCAGFCTIVSLRRKYVGDGISVDLDEVLVPEGMDYSIGEVEVMAESEEEVDAAQARIEEFMKKFGIRTQKEGGKVALGKVLSVIHRSRPDHFAKLKELLGDKYPKLRQV